jgi:hypothetical protein
VQKTKRIPNTRRWGTKIILEILVGLIERRENRVFRVVPVSLGRKCRGGCRGAWCDERGGNPEAESENGRAKHLAIFQQATRSNMTWR